MKKQNFISILTVLTLFMAAMITVTGCHKRLIHETTPVVVTDSASSITKISAVVGGNISDNGGQKITDRGIYFSNNGSPTDKSNKVSSGTGIGKFTLKLTGLKLNTKYYYMAYATNSNGTNYGQVLTFTTNDREAQVDILGYSNLGLNSIKIQTKITPYGSTIKEYGVCFGISTNPTPNNGKVISKNHSGEITIPINDLKANTKYYVRAYAITAKDTTLYSPALKIWTYALKDYDGNYYHAVKIGDQTFTVENLKVTHYRNGDPITNITGNTDWSKATTGAYCYYNNDTALGHVYGALYNWYALKDPRGLVPQGWHVPTFDEWETLGLYVGGTSVHGGEKLKEAGTKHWKAPNTGATNSTGFTALPGGARGDAENDGLGVFIALKEDTYFWSSSSFNGGGAIVQLFYDYDWMNIGGIVSYNSGLSIRLVKN